MITYRLTIEESMQPKKSEAKELKALDSYFKKAIKELAGYPTTQLFDYSKLFNFFSYHINNVGDPFGGSSNYRINTLDIEREVIDEFARLFHAPKDEYWGYVTNGGTEGNLYGLYKAREMYPDGVVFFSEQTHYSIEKISIFYVCPMLRWQLLIAERSTIKLCSKPFLEKKRSRLS